ncbi:ABC transporter ATP-binding protein [Erysipelothrix aquatica]|uniref:ABC transporter ATP-binding protein n=1 Tax=Erysipelothrix aquatica TaxID=2683714 RepID=UPI00135A727E|nr:ATP-binding cassette domain-containing protein [Erysipelothrix aquatica]
MISIQKLNFAYNQEPVLKNINLQVAYGEAIVLLGKSGCGKTTLLNLIGHIVKTDEGLLEVTAQRPAMIFQNFGLMPWLTVKQNIMLAMRAYPNRDIETEAQQQSNDLGIQPYLDRYPSQLSGGQKQRVAIARALSIHPDLLLVDEATSSLDTQHAETIQAILKSLQKNMTQIIVTHNIEEAIFLGKRILIMDQGEIVHEFDNPIYDLEEARHDIRFYEVCLELRGLFDAKTR